MEYKVIEFAQYSQDEICVFDSAYDAVDYIVARWRRGDEAVARMYIVDDDGTRIFGPTDLYQMGTAAA